MSVEKVAGSVGKRVPTRYMYMYCMLGGVLSTVWPAGRLAPLCGQGDGGRQPSPPASLQMEVEFPFRPTFEPDKRRDAVVTYLAGEALCDAGEHVEGIRKFKEASTIAWELSWERWPGWAEAIHAELTGTKSAAHVATCLADTASWTPQIAALPRAADMWWEAPSKIVADELGRRNVVVLDEFCGEHLAARARDEASRASVEGLLQPARVRNADNPATHPGSSATRSDRLCWAALEEERWSAVGEVSRRVDALILRLRDQCTALEDVRGRERVMVAAYGNGDAFARHADNHCLSGRGPHCNPRILTAVYYMSPDDWDPAAHGGRLRLYKPLDAAGEEHDESEDGDVLVEVAPVVDRLVLFWSDLRCPHEVLEITRGDGQERYSSITWYCSEVGAVAL